MKILRIDASARVEGSRSREVAGLIEKKLLQLHSDAEVVVRDIINKPIPHITHAEIEAFETTQPLTDAQKPLVQFSDELIDELLAADILLLSVPMYNFSMPSAFKAYIDHIVRVGKTFSYEEQGVIGLIEGKKCYIATALGGVYTGTEFEPMNFLTGYLQGLLGFLGIVDVEVFQLEGTDLDVDGLPQRKQTLMAQIDSIQAK